MFSLKHITDRDCLIYHQLLSDFNRILLIFHNQISAILIEFNQFWPVISQYSQKIRNTYEKKF
jgi:hypothetical protein